MKRWLSSLSARQRILGIIGVVGVVALVAVSASTFLTRPTGVRANIASKGFGPDQRKHCAADLSG